MTIQIFGDFIRNNEYRCISICKLAFAVRDKKFVHVPSVIFLVLQTLERISINLKVERDQKDPLDLKICSLKQSIIPSYL